jgi:predicted HicB family RNase H-like nuclease
MKGGLLMAWFRFEFDDDLHYEAKVHAVKERISLKELIHRAVKAYLKAVKKEG